MLVRLPGLDWTSCTISYGRTRVKQRCRIVSGYWQACGVAPSLRIDMFSGWYDMTPPVLTNDLSNLQHANLIADIELSGTCRRDKPERQNRDLNAHCVLLQGEVCQIEVYAQCHL